MFAIVGPDHRPTIYPADGTEARPIAGLAPDDAPIQWSADGGTLYVTRYGELPLSIYRFHLATGKKELWKQIMPADRAGLIGVFALAVSRDGSAYDLTSAGERACDALGVDVAATRALRRRFACPCLDWSERRPHVGGALGAALLDVALKRKWVLQDLDSRALTVTSAGRRELRDRFGIVDPPKA